MLLDLMWIAEKKTGRARPVKMLEMVPAKSSQSKNLLIALTVKQVQQEAPSHYAVFIIMIKPINVLILGAAAGSPRFFIDNRD